MLTVPIDGQRETITAWGTLSGRQTGNYSETEIESPNPSSYALIKFPPPLAFRRAWGSSPEAAFRMSGLSPLGLLSKLERHLQDNVAPRAKVVRRHVYRDIRSDADAFKL